MKKVGIAVVIIAVIAVVAWQFLGPAINFEKDDFVSLLEKSGITVEDLNESVSSFSLGLEETVIQDLKKGISEAPKFSATSAEFAGLMESLVSLDEKQSKIAREFDGLLDINMADFCINIESWEEKEGESDDLVVEAIDISSSLDGFYETNPGYSSLGIIIDTDKLADEQGKLTHTLNRLIDICIISAYSYEGAVVE